VRAHLDGPRLQILMSSNGFRAVDDEIDHIRRHFLETYLAGVNRPEVATEIGNRLAVLRRQKEAWIARYNAAPEPQKAQVVNDGLNQFVGEFASLNQYLEQFIGPWATVRVGDTITYTEGGRTEFATVTEIMYRTPAGFGIKARPAFENPRGRRVPAAQLATWQEIGARSGAGVVILAYDWYPSRWQRTTGNVPLMPGSRDIPFLLDWPKPAWSRYPTLYFGSRRPPTLQSALRASVGRDPTIREFPPSGGTLPGGPSIGINPPYRIDVGSIVGPLVTRTTPRGGRLLNILAPYGFSASLERMEGDHVHEIQLGGQDVLDNLWPLAESINAAAGPTLLGARARFRDGTGSVAVRDLRRLAGTEFYFEITKVR
jgi:hypothetical protein